MDLGKLYRHLELPKRAPTSSVALRVMLQLLTTQRTAEKRMYIQTIEEVVVGATVASVNLTTKIPANSIVLGAQVNFDTAITLVTAVKVGVGPTASPSQLALSTVTMTKNTKVDSFPLEASNRFTADTTIAVNACATGGTAAGTFAGTVRVLITFVTFESLPDAP